MLFARKKGSTYSILWILFLSIFLVTGGFGFAQQPELEFTTLNALENITSIKATSFKTRPDISG